MARAARRGADLGRRRLRHLGAVADRRQLEHVCKLKRDHELIVDGPYAFVRHPIYTGLLLALVGSALAVGEWRAALAVAIVAASFWRKLGIEEAVMRRQFGEA